MRAAFERHAESHPVFDAGESRLSEIRRCKIVDTGYNQAIAATFGISAFGAGLTRIVDNGVCNSEFSTGFSATGIYTASGIVERNRVPGGTGSRDQV